MFKDNLKRARKNANLSQEQVAEIIKTARSNISKYENGNLEPNLETLKLLCQLYKVSADELLEINTENSKIEKNEKEVTEMRIITKKEKNELYLRKEK